MSNKVEDSLPAGKSQTLEMQAKLLGRVERLLGSASSANPFSDESNLWGAFHEGWSRPIDEPVTTRRLRSRKGQDSG